jgi:TonB family protein
MIVVSALALLLAQIPSPMFSTCPPTPVRRIKPEAALDHEYYGHTRCYGIECIIAEVVVTVNPDGTVKNAVMHHSWNTAVDDAALRAARNSKYVAATVDCRPVESTYIFRQMFFIHRDSD